MKKNIIIVLSTICCLVMTACGTNDVVVATTEEPTVTVAPAVTEEPKVTTEVPAVTEEPKVTTEVPAATEPVEEQPTVVSVEATVVPADRYIGEELAEDDFVVKAKLSNGETVENFSDWYFSPEKITEEKTVITITYDGVETTVTVDAQKVPVTVTSVEAKVNGSHKIGETLSAADFTITAKMSDGSTRSNPAGWQADKLTLDSESTVITVTYEGISTKVTVAATQPQTQQQQPQPQQEQQPQAQKWPASAYGPVNRDAVQDLYDYAWAQGYDFVREDLGGGYGYWRAVKPGYSMSVVKICDEDGSRYWMSSYWRPGDNGRCQDDNLNGQTLEHIYVHMFQ